MDNDLETFNDFVDDLISSETNLLKYELDVLLMQYLFNSIDLATFKVIDVEDHINAAQQKLIMKFFYEKFWVPFFGGILSKFVFLIERKQTKNKGEKTKL